MKIGIDIDNTIVETTKYVVEYADFYAKTLNKSGINGNLDLIKEPNYLENIYNFSKKEVDYFLDTYDKDIYKCCTIKKYVSLIINKLKEENNIIYFITARRSLDPNSENAKITEETLRNNNIPFDKIIYNAISKLQYCKDNEIDLFIDDNYDVCKELKNNGITIYLMNSNINKNVVDNDMIRVNSWEEIYNKIHNK